MAGEVDDGARKTTPRASGVEDVAGCAVFGAVIVGTVALGAALAGVAELSADRQRLGALTRGEAVHGVVALDPAAPELVTPHTGQRGVVAYEAWRVGSSAAAGDGLGSAKRSDLQVAVVPFVVVPERGAPVRVSGRMSEVRWGAQTCTGETPNRCERVLEVGAEVTVVGALQGAGSARRMDARAVIARRAGSDAVAEVADAADTQRTTLTVAFMLSLLCWGWLVWGWRARALRRAQSRTSGHDALGDALWRGALERGLARLCAVDVVEIAPRVTWGEALAGLVGVTVRAGAFALFIALHGYIVSRLAPYWLSRTPLEGEAWVELGAAAVFGLACVGAAAVTLVWGLRGLRSALEGSPESARVSDVLLQALSYAQPLGPGGSVRLVGRWGERRDEASGEAVLALGGGVDVALIATATADETTLSARTTRDGAQVDQASWRRATQDDAGQGDVAQSMALALRRRLVGLGLGARADVAEQARRVDVAAALRASAMHDLEPREARLWPREASDVPTVARRGWEWASIHGAALGLGLGQAALVCWALWGVGEGALAEDWGVWVGQPSLEVLMPLVWLVAVVAALRPVSLGARRRRSVRVARPTLRWTGRALTLGGVEIDLERPFRVTLTREDGEGGALLLLGVTLAQSREGEEGVARLRVATPAAPSAAVERLDALDSDAPVLDAEAFEGWFWPLVAGRAAAHGEVFRAAVGAQERA